MLVPGCFPDAHKVLLLEEQLVRGTLGCLARVAVDSSPRYAVSSSRGMLRYPTL